MRRRERLPEAGERLAHVTAFRLELGEPRLELRGHLVERSAERRELVPPPDGDALAEGCRARSRGRPSRSG